MTEHEDFEHTTVMLHETVEALNLRPGDTAIDCTLGGGGHTELMLKKVGDKGTVIAFDRDSTAISAVQRRLGKYVEEGQLILVHKPFAEIGQKIEELKISGKIAGICADLGISSPQIDEAERGFSFMREGPLDMRMDQTQSVSARTIIQSYSEAELEMIFRNYGEEPKARHIARCIVKARHEDSFKTTLDLANFVAKNLHYKDKSRKNPATKIFQALRVAVNGELDQLKILLEASVSLLKPKGRMAVITFHSLEDRMVKNFFQTQADPTPADIDRKIPFTTAQLERLFPRQGTIIKPFPTNPSDQEVSRNSRARSAKLRVLERVGI